MFLFLFLFFVRMDLKDICVTSLVRNKSSPNRQPKSIRHNEFTQVIGHNGLAL